MKTQTLIIGGGLSGLFLASQLAEQGRDFVLLEARERLGGRIHSEQVGSAHFDMGPAWFWPGQPRMAALIEKLGLEKFNQYAHGALSFEDERGQVQRGPGFASMEGSYRLAGGLVAMIDGLARTIDPKAIQLSTPITSIGQTEQGILATSENGRHFSAQKVVLALPPRIAANLTFEPALPQGTISKMNEMPTWMAGQAKAIAVYVRPFWREDGLSGDTISRFGPMVEIHDASPADEDSYALFGFIGVPPKARQNEDQLKQQVLQQLGRLFGPQAAEPTQLLIKDWANDPFTSTELDLQPLYAHPHYGLPEMLSNLWGNRIAFAGTEVAPQFGGYLEGALESAECALSALATERYEAPFEPS